MTEMKAEGWYEDPWKIHERRWFSDGKATDLVGDGGRDGKDDPPGTSWDGPLVEWPTIDRGDAGDLRRADEAEETPAAQDPLDREWEMPRPPVF